MHSGKREWQIGYGLITIAKKTVEQCLKYFHSEGMLFFCKNILVKVEL